MKINPVDKQHLNSVAGVKKTSETNGDTFKKIFEQTSGSGSASEAQTSKPASGLRPPQAVSMRLDKHMDSMAEVKKTLNHLERYQHLLSDTRASLRAMEPVVRQLKTDMGNLESMMENPNVDDPAKAIVGETLVLVSKEVLRFEQGEYVDR